MTGRGSLLLLSDNEERLVVREEMRSFAIPMFRS
jgi:hypothetical protein